MKEFASIYSPSQEVTLVYNGKIIKSTTVYDINSNSSLNITLNSGHEIYLYEGFDSTNNFSKIKFSYEGQIYIGRVLTQDLSPYGINKTVIIS